MIVGRYAKVKQDDYYAIRDMVAFVNIVNGCRFEDEVDRCVRLLNGQDLKLDYHTRMHEKYKKEALVLAERVNRLEKENMLLKGKTKPTMNHYNVDTITQKGSTRREIR